MAKAKASGWHRKRRGPADRARQRKYDGAEHQAAKRAFTQLVAAGLARCWRPGCGRVLKPGRWHVGHDDHRVNVIRGPECVPCNLTAAARKGAVVANARRKAQTFVRAAR